MENQEKSQEKSNIKEIDMKDWSEYNQRAHDYPDERVSIRLYDLRQFIPKKNAALEVDKWVKKTKMMGITVICGVLVVAVGSNFNIWGGAIPAGIISVLGALAVKKAIEQEKYFAQEYNLNNKSDEF